MDAPPRTLTLACGALLWALLTAGSCATTPPPAKAKAKPPEPPPAAEPAPAPAPEAAPAAAPPAEPEPPVKDKDVEVVIDPGGEKAPVSLLEAGRAERERRANSGPPVAVITDKNLKQYAAKGQLTVADVRKSKPPAAAAPEGGAPIHDEQYWRSRGREIRTRWKNTAEELKKLEAAAAGLRRSFYAEDDPYVRDSKVKPEWDRVLDRLQEARDEVEAVKKELADFEEEGRREGALPGWLREGSELVPEAEKKKNDFDEHKPIEPPEYVPSQPPPTR